jgi:hypothetical protein
MFFHTYHQTLIIEKRFFIITSHLFNITVNYRNVKVFVVVSTKSYLINSMMLIFWFSHLHFFQSYFLTCGQVQNLWHVEFFKTT